MKGARKTWDLQTRRTGLQWCWENAECRQNKPQWTLSYYAFQPVRLQCYTCIHIIHTIIQSYKYTNTVNQNRWANDNESWDSHVINPTLITKLQRLTVGDVQRVCRPTHERCEVFGLNEKHKNSDLPYFTHFSFQLWELRKKIKMREDRSM